MFLRLCCAAGVALTMNIVARSAYLSEVFISGTASAHTNAIEISGIASDTTLELLVLDANPSTNINYQRSTIEQIFRVNTQGHITLLLHQDTWNPSLYNTFNHSLNSASLSDSSVTGATDFDFAGPRTLVLLDKPTALSAGSSYLAANTIFLNGATELDVMTWNFGASAVALRDETVMNIEADDVVSLALDPSSTLPTTPVAGEPNALGQITGYDGYYVTPGRANMQWQPQALPEPSSSLLVIIGVLTIASRRNRIRMK